MGPETVRQKKAKSIAQKKVIDGAVATSRGGFPSAASPPAVLTHARRWPQNPAPGVDRTSAELTKVLAYIAEDMVTGQFIRGVSWRRYAEMGQVSDSCAKNWVSQAQRLAFDTANRDHIEELRVETLGWLSKLIIPAVNDRDYKAAESLMRLRADLGGALSARPVFQLNIGGVPVNLDAVLDAAQRVEWLGEAVKQISMGHAPQLPEPTIVEQDPVLQSLESEASAGGDDGVMRLAGYRVAGTLDKDAVVAALEATLEWWRGQ